MVAGADQELSAILHRRQNSLEKHAKVYERPGRDAASQPPSNKHVQQAMPDWELRTSATKPSLIKSNSVKEIREKLERRSSTAIAVGGTQPVGDVKQRIAKIENKSRKTNPVQAGGSVKTLQAKFEFQCITNKPSSAVTKAVEKLEVVQTPRKTGSAVMKAMEKFQPAAKQATGAQAKVLGLAKFSAEPKYRERHSIGVFGSKWNEALQKLNSQASRRTLESTSASAVLVRCDSSTSSVDECAAVNGLSLSCELPSECSSSPIAQCDLSDKCLTSSAPLPMTESPSETSPVSGGRENDS